MIYYFLKNKLAKSFEFPYDVLVFRCSRLKRIEEPYKSLDSFKVTKFAGRLMMEGEWRRRLFEDGLDRSRFHSSLSYERLNRKWERLPFRQGRFRCFLAQDIKLGKKEKRKAYQERIEGFLTRFKDTIVVKPHPVHIYRGAVTPQSIWWGETCERLGIPYEGFPEREIASYAQTISMYSTGNRWSPHSDNVVLGNAYLPRFFGARQITDFDEAEDVLSVSEEEAEWRKTRFSWLIGKTTFPDGAFRINIVKNILLYHYEKEPLDDLS